MPLNLIPAGSSSLTLTPTNPIAAVASTYGQAVYGVSPYGASPGMVIAPLLIGSLPLTPDPPN